MRKAQATISPFSCFTSSMVPATVPPVASKSSTMSTFAPGANASLSIVVMSLKRIPGLGKSGTSRMRAARSFVVAMRGSLEHPLATRVHVIAREEAFHVAAFVVDDDDGDRGVRLRRRVELREDAEVVRGEDARHTAVANDEHRAAGILAMEPPHRAKSALEHAFERLAAGPR